MNIDAFISATNMQRNQMLKATPWTRQEAIDFALASVRSARGCASDFANLEEALDAYRVNLQDTMNEKGVHAHDQMIAHEAFDLEAYGS